MAITTITTTTITTPRIPRTTSALVGYSRSSTRRQPFPSRKPFGYSFAAAPSARGPRHLAPAEEVQVDVCYRLLSVRTVVKDGAVTLRQPFVGGDPLRHQEQ